MALPGTSVCRAPGRGARRSASLVVPWAMLGGWVKGFRGAECPEGGPPVNAAVKGRPGARKVQQVAVPVSFLAVAACHSCDAQPSSQGPWAVPGPAAGAPKLSGGNSSPRCAPLAGSPLLKAALCPFTSQLLCPGGPTSDANIHREILTWAVCKNRGLGRWAVGIHCGPRWSPLAAGRATFAVQRENWVCCCQLPELVEGPRPVGARSCCPVAPGRALGPPKPRGHTVGAVTWTSSLGSGGSLSPPCWGVGRRAVPSGGGVGAPRSHK